MGRGNPKKRWRTTGKSLTLVDKPNTQNALFHYNHYRKPRSGVVNVLRQVQRLVAKGFGRRRLTSLRWRREAEEFGGGSGRRHAFELAQERKISMNDQIKELVRKYWRREVNKDEFVALVKNEIGDRRQDFRVLFDSVIQNKNADEVEMLLVILYALESDDNMIGLIHQLILEPWHREYEELAHDLQRRRNPESVPILKEAMQRKYQYLESYGTGTRQFINQCGHALRSIGTEDAISVVRELGKSSDPIVRDEMRYRLSRIEGRNDYQRTF